MHGHGTYTYSGRNQGDVYTGGWQNDLKHGQGIYRWNCGHVYEGGFENGKMHGQGKFT